MKQQGLEPFPSQPRFDIPLEFVSHRAEIGHTCHNRFLVLDCRGTVEPSFSGLAELAANVCSSPFADDLLVLQDSETADFRLRIIGGDRREADFCGNGLLYAANMVGSDLDLDELTVQMATGVRCAKRRNSGWSVEIGPVHSLAPTIVPQIARGSMLAMLYAGEPHLILRAPSHLSHNDISTHTFDEYCRPISERTNFIGGVNVTMIFGTPGDRVKIRTYERGARRATTSCGTGSTAAAAAVLGLPLDHDEILVESPGGQHRVNSSLGRWMIAAQPTRLSAGRLSNLIRPSSIAA